MRAKGIESDRELQQVLWACYDFWKASDRPPREREFCYEWIVGSYEGKFGRRFHQSKLRRLAGLGYLERGDVSRGGGRRYYKLVSPDQIPGYLKTWGLSD